MNYLQMRSLTSPLLDSDPERLRYQPGPVLEAGFRNEAPCVRIVVASTGWVSQNARGRDEVMDEVFVETQRRHVEEDVAVGLGLRAGTMTSIVRVATGSSRRPRGMPVKPRRSSRSPLGV
jgi:hypothetical protein